MTYNPDDSLLLQLRDAAKVERDELVRFNMRKIADELQTTLAQFKILSTTENLAKLNGLWSRGIRQLGFATGIDPLDGGAKMRLAA